jgi:hypothetical protein
MSVLLCNAHLLQQPVYFIASTLQPAGNSRCPIELEQEPCCCCCLLLLLLPLLLLSEPGCASFLHGVASGDPRYITHSALAGFSVLLEFQQLHPLCSL